MSLKPLPIGSVPELTAQIAHAAFPKGNLYMRLRDELGTLYTDEDFASVYPRRGQPALAPWRLALVTVMQFLENLSDRQAADAVRARIDWKYALGLELTDAGFHHSVLGEFRDRLAKCREGQEGKAEQFLLERMLEHFREKGLLKVRGRQRTDSTHVLASIRVMNRLELVGETLRAALNELATVAPDWLRSVAPAQWYERYGQRVEETRLPRGENARVEYAQTVGRDGFALLDMLNGLPVLTEPAVPVVPAHLPDLPTLQTLRQVWERHYERKETGEALWRAGPDLSRAAGAIESPYDPQARHSTKHALSWTGYKVHLTETCDEDLPRLITHVHTTVATTQDVSCTAEIQQALADKALLPARHLVDAGYIDAELLAQSQKEHGIDLFGPPRSDKSWQAREGGFDHSHFRVDWEREQVTCPEGKTSAWWGLYATKPYGYSVVKARFRPSDCAGCTHRDKCIRSTSSSSRVLSLPPRPHYEALVQMRARIGSEEGRREYRMRAGVEGTLSQGVRRCDLRHCRYRGLDKTHLQHVATAAALNLARAVNHLSQKPLARTRVSRFSRLAAAA